MENRKIQQCRQMHKLEKSMYKIYVINTHFCFCFLFFIVSYSEFSKQKKTKKININNLSNKYSESKTLIQNDVFFLLNNEKRCTIDVFDCVCECTCFIFLCFRLNSFHSLPSDEILIYKKINLNCINVTNMIEIQINFYLTDVE